MLCDYLREYRKKMGFTQQEIAKILGIERSTYAYYETGKTQIPTMKLHTLAKLYAVDLNDFFDFESGITLNASEKEKSEKTEVGKLSKEERELLAKVRLLGSDIKREELYEFLEKLSKEDKM